MANGTSSLNPTVLGRPLFPSMGRIRQALSGLRDSAQQNFGNYSTSPTMMAGAAGINPYIASSISPIRGPLIRTDYGRPPSERPDFRNPAEQWDVRKPVQTVGSAPATPTAPSFLSPEQQRFYDYSRLSPQSRDVVSAVKQQPQAGMAGGTMQGLPSVSQQFPFEQYREPMAPVTADISGLTERVGVRTAYGMVYPTKGQEAAAQRLAQMPAMGARLAEAGKMTQAERLAMVRRNALSANVARTKAYEETMRKNALEIQEQRNLAEQNAPQQIATRSPSRSKIRMAERQARRNEQRNLPFLGFDSVGNPVMPVPDGRGGYVVRNEEGGYSPYG